MPGRNPLTGLNLVQREKRILRTHSPFTRRNPLTGLNLVQQVLVQGELAQLVAVAIPLRG